MLMNAAGVSQDRGLRALARAPETVRELCRWAGLQTLEMAVQRGLPEERARPVERLLRRGEGGNG
jgi:hypothetical protein